MANYKSNQSRLVLFAKAGVDGEGTKRKEYLDKLLELFPSDKRVQYLAGQYYQNIERDFKTALQYYRGVTELDKNYAPVYDDIAFAQDSTFIGALAGLGDSYSLKGDYKQAHECYENAIARAADLSGYGGKLSTLDRIASSYVLEGRVDEALSTYKRYRSLAETADQIEEIITSYQNEGFILTETGNPGEGLRRYQMATEVLHQPKTPEAVKKTRTLPSMFGECYALLANNDVEAALAKMKECSRMAENRKVPGDARWMSFLNGLVESKEGNYAKALEHYSSSWPDFPFIKYYVAVTYEKMGEKEKATELYKEIENWNANNLALALVKQRMRKMTAN